MGGSFEYKASHWQTGRWTKATVKVIENGVVVVKTESGKWNELDASQYDIRLIQVGLESFLPRGLEVPGTTRECG